MVNVAKIAVGVLLAVALALGVYGWMLARAPQAPDPQAQASAGNSQPNASLSVVVAAQAVPAGQALKAEDLQLMQLPAKPDGAFGEIQAAIGAVPAVDIPKGAPVLQGQMVTGLALKLSEGERAVAVKVDESIGAGNRIRPGDFVDVFFALRRDGNEIDQSQARLLLAQARAGLWRSIGGRLVLGGQNRGQAGQWPRQRANCSACGAGGRGQSVAAGRLQWQPVAGTAQSHGYDRAG